jgi:hypothetical protein
MLKRLILAAAGLGMVAVVGALLYSLLAPSDRCDVCYRPLHEETLYRIHLAYGKVLDACCPRCGLRYQKGRRDVLRTEAIAFYSKELLHGEAAFYVEGSSVHFCSHAPLEEDRSGVQYEVAWDRCLPSLIAFESEATARSFQARNGGVVKTYEELLAEESP